MSTDAVRTTDAEETIGDRWLTLICEDDYRPLWREFHDRLFHTIFVRNSDGTEEPALARDGTNLAFVAATDELDAQNALEKHALTAEGDFFLKPVELSHLARSAREQEVRLQWPGQLGFGDTVMWCLGDVGIVRNDSGEEIAYESHAYRFEDGTAQKAPPYGALQQWCTCDPTLRDEMYDDMECFRVYDDLLDWDSNPRMPDVPADAVPLSSLSDSAQVFFRRTQKPLLPARRPTKTPEAETVPTIPGNPLVPDNLLGDFARWRHQVSQRLIPGAEECRLTIGQSIEGTGSDRGKQSPETWQVQIDLPDRYGALISGTIPIDPSLLKEESNPLPSKPGSHPISHEFREYLVSYISWVMFHHARSLWPAFVLEADALRAIFPARPANAYEVFVPDYKDERFPCLAGIPCGDHELPVILLGQAHGNYICRALPHAPIPEQALPPALKGKDKLVQEGQLVYGNSNAPLMAPVSLIEFPEHWYTGARSPAEFHVSAMASYMEFNVPRRKERQSPGTPKPQPALTMNPFIKVSVTLLVGVSLFALLKSF